MKFHSLLDRQIKNHLGSGTPPPELQDFLNAINDSYTEHFANHSMLERSLDMAMEELERTNKELRIYSKELQRSNQALTDFSAIASHDLKEPLRKISTFSQRPSKNKPM